ncbi:hypothetical protein KI387_042992 [Taxus chinensis]|uniref:F-box domain-containing protein n=1 Tax=Taxus chinensis TaxID=29808 RepID=A0AA38C7W3_TAXCH|nr:hypothetical protein KI387_042992 [Taxus chinensis]
MEIFHGLPEEIGRECLLRVAYKFHRQLRGVCRKWKAVVNSSEYKEEQVRRGICEERICYLVNCIRPNEGELKIFHPILTHGTRNPTKRAAVYDVEKDTWNNLPDMNRPMWECEGVYVAGKFYVIPCLTLDNVVQVFDTEKGTWTTLANTWTRIIDHKSLVAALGRLYYFTKNGVLEYDSEGNMWRLIADLPCLPPGRVTLLIPAVWRDKIMVTMRVCTPYPDKNTFVFKFTPPSDSLPQPAPWIEVPQFLSSNLRVVDAVTVYM